MQTTGNLSSLWDTCRSVLDHATSMTGFYCQEKEMLKQAAAKLSNIVPPSANLDTLKTTILLLFIGLGVLSSLCLSLYYCRFNIVQKTAWNVDQVNKCLIPLGIAVALGAIYYVYQ